MKKILVLLVVLGIMVATCPSRDDHKTAITNAINGAVNETISSAADDSNVGTGIAFLGSLLANSVVNVFIDQVMDYQNYFIFSKTEGTFDGETKTLSYGVFGHVFTVDKEEMKRRLQEKE